MKVDAVFAGGGVKAFAFIGAIEAAEKKGLQFERIAGTSAGAIIAGLLMAGYSSMEINRLLDELDVKALKDDRMSLLPFKVAKWVNLYFRLGLYKGDKLESWLKNILANKGVTTFGDLPQGALRVIASDITKGQMVIIPDDLTKYGIDPDRYSVAKAIRMSCSIPFFFEPVKLHNKVIGREPSYMVDGGVLSNFPMWLFKDGRQGGWRRPVIGFQLSPRVDERPGNKVRNALDLYKAVFETMMSAHDVRYISQEHAKNIVFIPIKQIKATDFSLSEEEKLKMIELGKEKTNAFFSTWTI
ncbi:patatin-like phospholipase family protein [Shouchella patagoniensis]|uniref:patatin-like phospholipase family protein n=1 Tax=Shouchella patagoniensis TaxID=228576 RepID=UPI000994AA70|nr:patatin-like phospholipase family protein [Shouchella patagoniensis]